MAEQTLKEKTAKGLFWGGLSNGVQQVLNALFGLILARVLDASDYGMVGMLAIFSAIASTIQESGFTAALTNHDDKKVIESELKKFNLKTSIQPGYLYFEKEMRSAIIRFWS